MRPPRKGRRFGTVLAMVTVAMLVTVPAHAAVESDAVDRQGGGMPARLGDRFIDLTQGWGEAEACLVWPDVLDVPECFDTEADMDRRITELEAEMAASVGSSGGGVTATTVSSCASYLRLYDGT